MWILVFFLWKTSTIHIELLFRNAPAKSSWTDLLWFGLPGPLLKLFFVSHRLWQPRPQKTWSEQDNIHHHCVRIMLFDWSVLRPHGVYVGLPRKQKIAVNKFWVQESEIGGECRQFWTWLLGVNFLGWPETLEKQGQKIRDQNSPSKLAEKFAGNFPKIRRTKIKNSPKIRSA